MNTHTGACLCGRLRYRVSSDPLTARICWCRTCQRISGNGTANAIFRSESLQVDGDPSNYVSVADSGNTITRYFCPSCGCHVFAASSASPAFRVIRIGTLDDPSAIKPQVNIWTSSAPSWACMNPDIALVEHQPAPPASHSNQER